MHDIEICFDISLSDQRITNTEFSYTLQLQENIPDKKLHKMLSYIPSIPTLSTKKLSNSIKQPDVVYKV